MRRRISRTVWVLVANLLAIYFAIYGSSDVRHLRSLLVTDQPLGPAWQDYSRGVIPAAGMLLELFNLRIAKYINVGYFLVLTVFWGIVCTYNWADAHARLYSATYSSLALLVAVVDSRLYRNKKTGESAASSERN